MGIRTGTVGGVPFQYPWGPTEEVAFQKWWAQEGRVRIGRAASPDHSRNDGFDVRTAWYLGFRNVSSKGVEYRPSAVPDPVNPEKRYLIPEEKVDTFKR